MMMNSKREEERNEKIVRGLMKLPPNRRCINCNSLGPQYVCTSFWTFICTTCSGIHREFTHRVKSVSMAKFTFQEVDALQKGGNQRARELFLKAWDPQRNIFPDNSKAEKVREFIKNVYVDKIYSSEKSSDRPPRDPQSLRSHEDEMRRASSYHSYSQSPPYDFQYEERRYGKNAPALTRRPGSDRGLYEGKLASFLSPSSLSDDGFANEGSHPRVSDYSVPGGGDPFRSNALSPDSQRNTRSPSREISGDFSIEVPQLHAVQHDSDANVRNNSERTLHPQRTTSLGSIESIGSNSMLFKSETSLCLPEVGSKPERSDGISLEKSISYPSLLQSSKSFGGLDLFTPFAQTANNTPPDSGNSQLLAQPVSVDPLSSNSPVSSFTGQQPSQIPQPPPLDMFAAPSQHLPLASSNEKPSDVVTNGGWATFDQPQNVVPTATEKPDNGTVPSPDRNFNPFSVDHSSYQVFMDHGPFAETHAFGHESLRSVDATIYDSQGWNAFDDFTGENINPNMLQSSEQTAVHFGFNDDNSLGTYEAATSVGDVAGAFSFAIDHKPANPFDTPFDSDIEPSNTFWDMGSLQASLPDVPIPAAPPDLGGNQSWDPQNIHVSGVSFDSATGSMEHMPGQAPYTNMPNGHHDQGPVAFIGGNPFA